MTTQDFNPKQLLLQKIEEKGGMVNAHAHIDRSYIVDDATYHLTDTDLRAKWDHPDNFKRSASVDAIYEKMKLVVDNQIAQGVKALGTFIDVDPVVGDKAIQAAKRVRADYKGKIVIKFANQVVKGVLEPEARKWFEVGAEFVDFIGGLPEKDKGHEAEHLDVLFETAKKHGKPLHVHVDQLNMPDQRDTELLVEKTIQHGCQGKVVAIHCISVWAQPREYRYDLYRRMKEAGIIVVSCPGAWLDNSWVANIGHDVIGPLHASVTPGKEMMAAGVPVALGTDGIQDIYTPFTDGDMWTELRMFLQANRLYDLDILSEIAAVNGRKALFL